MPICKNCGTYSEEGKPFCHECGAKLVEEPAPETAAPAAAFTAAQPEQPVQPQQTFEQPQQPYQPQQTYSQPRQPYQQPAQQQYYQPQQPQYNYGQPQQPVQPQSTTTFNEPPKQKSGAGTASLVFGILSLVCCFVPVLGQIFPLLGFILGLVGIKKSGAAKAGLILSIISFVLSAIVLIIFIINAANGNLDALFNGSGNWLENIFKDYSQYFEDLRVSSFIRF